MTFEIREGQIFIHKNNGAEGNKPLMKGTLMVGGQQYEIALWGSRSGKDGSYSGKVSLPREKQQAETHKGLDRNGDVPNSHVETTPALDAMNDEIIPF